MGVEAWSMERHFQAPGGKMMAVSTEVRHNLTNEAGMSFKINMKAGAPLLFPFGGNRRLESQDLSGNVSQSP